ncbi:MAG: alpha/beta hydrolase [Actinomycetota bacterium]|nr:alpha/beta hydrolase [Actinomycetota bacterium]
MTLTANRGRQPSRDGTSRVSAAGAGYSVHGQGPVVMLVHSSVSGSRQWRTLIEVLADRYCVVAVDLVGYGQTPAWHERRPQRLHDQSALLHSVAEQVGPPLALVGHSFGGSVALCAAAELGSRLPGLVLLEPNPFSLLRESGADSYQEVLALRDAVKSAGDREAWPDAAQVFADYWNGAGTWAAMSADRRHAFARLLPPNYHEWDAVMAAPAAQWVSSVSAATWVVTAADTVPPIAQIARILKQSRPDWRFEEVPAGGHMTPLTRPELVNPLVASAVDELLGPQPLPAPVPLQTTDATRGEAGRSAQGIGQQGGG